MTAPLKSAVQALCWIAVVGGAIVFIAGAYTGYVEGVEADAAGTVGRVMPAEIASFVLGPVIAIAGVVVAVLVPRASKVPVATR